VPQRDHAPPRSEMQPKALREPAPEYMIRLYEDFRTHVIER
jgi:putative spermidine/putrescine transport system substrate-binding protein